MSIPFRLAPFKSANGAVARSINDRFGDVVDVSEFANLHEGAGTFGSWLGDDAPCFQAAFDKAFTTDGVPNGWDNRHLNKPVRIPRGRFVWGSTVTLTKVVGGHIYGPGKHSSQIWGPWQAEDSPTLLPSLHLNGCSDLCLDKFSVHSGGNGGGWHRATNTCCVLIDWDGDDSDNGCDGNHGNHFQEMQHGGGEFGIVIGSDAASEGHGMLFINTNVAANTGGANDGLTGYLMRGPKSSALAIGGGSNYHASGLSGSSGAWCPPGGGSFFSQGLAQGGNDVDFIMESGQMMHIGQLRSESIRLLKMNSGVVNVQCATGTSGMVEAIRIDGGICNVEGCQLHDSGQIIGTGGKLALWGTNFGSSVTPLSGYSGEVVWNPLNVPA